MLKIAFIGLPNVGKSSLINSLSNSVLKTGNWPGVTVEKKEVYTRIKDRNFHFIDLPGTNSLESHKTDEMIPLKFLLEEDKVDCIVNVIDSTNLEKNLVLTLQLKETSIPMILAFNFQDEFKKYSFSLDKDKLENLLGCKIIFVSSKTRHGVDELLDQIYYSLKEVSDSDDGLDFKQAIVIDDEHEHEQQHNKNDETHIREFHQHKHHRHHLKEIDALNLKEKSKENVNEKDYQHHHVLHYINDKDITLENNFCFKVFPSEITQDIASNINKLKFVNGKYISLQTMLFLESLNSVWFCEPIDEKYVKSKNSTQNIKAYRKSFIKQILSQSNYNFLKEKQLEKTRKIDGVLLNKYLAPVFALLILSSCFGLTFSIANPFIDFIDAFFNGVLAKYISYLLDSAGFVPDIVKSFVIDGLVSAVGLTFSFIPLIFLLNLFLALLQESGYISRVAFTFEKIVSLFGLSGRAIFPLLIGFGCNVPTIYGLKILKDENEKRISVFLAGFISCGARLPVFGLFASAFFAKNILLTITSMYATGMIFVVIVGFFLKLKFKSQKSSNIIEMPLYRVPSLRNTMKSSYIKTKMYAKRIALIVRVTLVLWVLGSFPSQGENSFIGMGAKALAPIFKPLGFGDRWELIASLPSSIIAKEGAITSIATFLKSSQDDKEILQYDILQDMKSLFLTLYSDITINLTTDIFGFMKIDTQTIQSDFGSGIIEDIGALWTDENRLFKAISFMIFILLTVPCIVTLTAIKNEFSIKLMIGAVLSYFLISYFASLIFYQLATLIF